jgi:hypothetical protein
VSSPGLGSAWCSQVFARIAFERLSPSFQSYLETLKVLHSGARQNDYSRKGQRGGVIRRESVDTIHPLVRRHPVTGEKALFVNRFFCKHIVGLREEESTAILELLYKSVSLFAFACKLNRSWQSHPSGSRLSGSHVRDCQEVMRSTYFAVAMKLLTPSVRILPRVA